METRSFLFYFYFTILNSLIVSLLYHCYNGNTSQVQNLNKSIYTKLYKLTNFKVLLHFLPEIHLEILPLLGSR